MRVSTSALLLLAACNGDSGVKVYNEEPVVNIVSPPTGTAYDEAEAITFEGRVSDNATAADQLSLRWASDLDGELGTDPASAEGVALFTTASLSVGNHAITLSATDEDGALAQSAAITITINDVPDNPEVIIVHPMAGETGVDNEDFEFVAKVSDEQQAPETLTLTLHSDIDGDFCQPAIDVLGEARCTARLSAGVHTLTYTVVDEDNLAGVAEYYFTVDKADGDGDGQDETQGDCDDDNPDTYQGATEQCDGQDNDCDDVVDEDTECNDDDGDGLAEIAGDCNDASSISYPGAPEIEDGMDNDCDGTVDEGTNAYDDDGDGYTENAGDCNDASASANPAASESCDGVDDDCDGTSDEANASGCTTYYYDYDGDGYGSAAVAGQCLCTYSGYYTSGVNTDCYDYNASASPAAAVYSTSHRGDGSYDWNCDGSETKYYTSTGGCGSWPGCSATAGWDGSVKSCGTSGSYVYDCGVDWFSCAADTTTYTQKCL